MATDRLNKVLNRPLFRAVALRKGDLKPIKAQSGRIIGTNPFGPKGVMVGSPTTPAMNLPVPAGPVIDRTPGMFQKGLGAIQRGLQFVGDYAMNPMSKDFFLRKRGLKDLGAGYGLYELGKGITGSETGGGLTSIAGMFNPITRGVGVAKALTDLGQYALGAQYDPKTDVMSTRFGDIPRFMGGIDEPGSPAAIKTYIKSAKEQKAQAKKERDISNLLTAPDETINRDYSGLSYGMEAGGPSFANMSDEEQNKVVGRNAVALAEKTGISVRKAANLLNASYFGTVKPEVANAALQDDVIYAQTIPNKYKDPNISQASTTVATPPEASEPAFTATTDEKNKPKKLGDGKIDLRKPEKPESPSTTNKEVTSSLVSRAREIYKELAQGRSSNANLVFLANLASGLLSGKTSKSGLGGALEVLGAALGPATSNYAIMKLKEDEISNKLMTEALDAAAVEAAALAKAKGTMTDATSGVIQFIDKDGNISNKIGRRLKNGVTQVQTGPNQFATVQQGSSLEGFQVGDFIKEGLNNDGQLKLMDASRQRIKAYRTLNQALTSMSENEGVAGVTGTINLALSRAKGALSDLGLAYSDETSEMRSKLDSQRLQMKARIDDAKRRYEEGDRELSKEQIKKMEEIYDSAKKYEQRVIEKYRNKGITDSAVLEKLAVDEVTLTYALANSFKDTDRLTQRDIDAASKIVNIFTWTRGSKNVADSLRAIGANLKSDIDSFRKSMQALGATDTKINLIFGDYDSMTFGDQFTKTAQSFQGIKTDELKQNKSLKDLQLGK